MDSISLQQSLNPSVKPAGAVNSSTSDSGFVDIFDLIFTAMDSSSVAEDKKSVEGVKPQVNRQTKAADQLAEKPKNIKAAEPVKKQAEVKNREIETESRTESRPSIEANTPALEETQVQKEAPEQESRPEAVSAEVENQESATKEMAPSIDLLAQAPQMMQEAIVEEAPVLETTSQNTVVANDSEEINPDLELVATANVAAQEEDLPRETKIRIIEFSFTIVQVAIQKPDALAENPDLREDVHQLIDKIKLLIQDTEWGLDQEISQKDANQFLAMVQKFLSSSTEENPLKGSQVIQETVIKIESSLISQLPDEKIKIHLESQEIRTLRELDLSQVQEVLLQQENQTPALLAANPQVSEDEKLFQAISRLSHKIKEDLTKEGEAPILKIVDPKQNPSQEKDLSHQDLRQMFEKNPAQNLRKTLFKEGFSSEFVQVIETRETQISAGQNLEGRKSQTVQTLRQPGFLSSTRVVLEQIQEATKQIRLPEINKLQMVLKPEHLGEMKLEIVHEKEGLRVRFEAESTAVKDVIEKNLPALRESLKQQGLDKFEVDVVVKDFSSSMQEKSHQQEEGRRRKPKQEDTEFSLEPAQIKDNITQQGGLVNQLA